MESVKDKVALVTGGSGGIGFAMVQQLLKNGAKGVAIVDISEKTGLEAVKELSSIYGNNKVIFIKTDVTDKDQLEGAFLKTVEMYKQLDIVVNNAGIVDELDWKKALDINLVAVVEGSYLAMQKYLPKYRSGEDGVVVNTASILGLCTIATAPIYCTSKHGVIGLGRTLGCKPFYKKYKTRVLTICPGLVDTPLIKTGDFSKVLLPELMPGALMSLNKFAIKPERIGEALIEVIRIGKNGSLWVVEDDEPMYQVQIPERKLMNV